MKRHITLISVLVIVFLTFAVLLPKAHRLARKHVNYMTATEDHPLNCISCHVYRQKAGIITKLITAHYYSPFNLAVTRDGKTLFVVAEEGNALLVVDIKKQEVVHKIDVGLHPHSVILNKDESIAYVSNQWSDNVSVISIPEYAVTGTLKTGDGPAELALSADGQYLLAVNSFSSDLSVIDLKSKEEWKRLPAGNNPTGIQSTPDGSRLFITSRRTVGAPYGDTVECEMTVVDDKKQQVVERRNIKSAYLMENIAFTPSGDLGIFPLIRPKNNVPTVQVDRGWMMTTGFGIIETKQGGRTIQLLMDEPNRFFADPYDIAITPDGKEAFISCSGVNFITVINIDEVRSLITESNPEQLKTFANHLGISSRYVMKRIPTGWNPKGIVVSADGSTLYVAEHLEDRIAVIDTRTLETVNTIDLGGPHKITVNRQGRRLFNNAGHTFQTQYSCYTCHPDTHEDGLVYNMASKDMGRNLTNTQSLRDIGDTPPFKWSGKNQTIYKQDGMRFSTVLTRTEPFAYKDLDALVAYITTDIHYPPNLQYNPNGELTKNQLAGKAIFERTHTNSGKEIPASGRCITCHPPPYYTNLKMANVGTLAASDDSILFDTPHLNNIYASAPYLHDGRAKTLEEIWTLYGKSERHGVVNDLTKMDLNYLIDYLKSLRSPEYDIKSKKVAKAAF